MATRSPSNRLLATTVATTVLTATASAHAIPVIWQVSGNLTFAAGQYLPSSVVAGAAFSFLLHFDTNAPVSNPTSCEDGGSGRRCNYYGYPGLSFENIQVNGVTVLSFVGTPADNVIIVRNNAPAPLTGVIVDGITWAADKSYSSFDGPATTYMSLIMRGSENLGAVTNASVLPTTPILGMLDLSLRQWDICDGLDSIGDCGWANVVGQVDSIAAVPESGTSPLMVVGLVSIAGLIRRRRG